MRKIVLPQQSDRVVVDVGDEAWGGVEVCVGAFVCAEEVAGVVGVGGVGWGVGGGFVVAFGGWGGHGGE